MKRAIMLVGGGLLQQRAVEIARDDLGLHVIVTDREPNCHCASMADEFYVVDTKDVVGHIKLATALAGRKEPHLSGVFTQGHSVEITVSETARAIGLPGFDPKIARQIANKGAMRQTINSIFPMKLGIYSDFQSAFIGTSGSPEFVVKPEDSSGSRGLTKVHKHSEFTHAIFDRAKACARDGNVVIEELLESDGSACDVPIGENRKAHCALSELSVETVWENGKGHWLNAVARPFFSEKEFAIEAGHFNPAVIHGNEQAKVEQVIMAAGRALGMTTGILKFDIMLTKDGPRVLETTARLSGGFDAQYTSPLAHGTNYIRGAMRMALGEPIPWEDFIPKWHRHAVALSAFPKLGRVTAIKGIESAMKIKGVEHIIPRVKIGDMIQPYVDCTGRPLFVIASGDTRDGAIESAEKALDTIRIETEAR